MNTTTAPASTPTDVTDNPHWHLTTAQATDHFNREHADKPREEWTAVDIETWLNLHLAT